MKKTTTSPLSAGEGQGVRPSHRQLLGTARWYYQRHALCTEHVDEEIRLILAGKRGGLRRLHMLQARQAAALKHLEQYLQQIAGHIRKDDTDEFREYLDTQAQKIALSAKYAL